VDEFDFIIIGAGSAGCVLADKLTTTGRHNVLVLEAGPSDNRFWINTPIGYGITYTDSSINWNYFCEPEKTLGGRSMYWPRGKVLGGSSSINALVYHRGQAMDYDDWAAAGNPGWDYQTIRSAYDDLEDFSPPADNNRWPGSDNPGKSKKLRLSITDAFEDYHSIKTELDGIFSQSGLPYRQTPPLEGEGLGPYFITTRQGKRCSSATAFLHPATKRPHLKVLTHATVEKIIINDHRAEAVVCRHEGRERRFLARREILVCTGAINSPKLLQLSGIGPGELLRRFNIPVLIDQPNVGRHLQDHLGISYYYRANRPTLNDVLGSWPGRIRSGLQYLLRRTGPLSLSVNQFGGLARSTPTSNKIDTQLYFNPVSYQPNAGNERKLTQPDPYSGFILGFNACRPTSTGWVKITSPNPEVAPRMSGGYLSTQKDLDDVVAMARLLGRIQGTEGLSSLLLEPPQLDLSTMTDADIIEDFQQRATTVYHPCGTCRMGPKPDRAVVDAELRVHGTEALRVVDASVFPNITSANTNAPTLMVARRAAQMILATTDRKP
jgi:choline dehydrogenase